MVALPAIDLIFSPDRALCAHFLSFASFVSGPKETFGKLQKVLKKLNQLFITNVTMVQL